MSNNKTFKNIIYGFIKTAATALIPLISFPYIVRVLTPEFVGKIDFATAFVGYFGLLATLGSDVYAIRECAAVKNDKDKLGKTASEIFTLNFCSMIIALVLMVIVMFSFSSFHPYINLISVLSLTIIFTVLGTTWLNNAMEDFGFLTVCTLVFQSLVVILYFIFIKSENDYFLKAIISLFPIVAISVLNITYRRRFCKVKLVRDMQPKKHLTPIILLFGMIVTQQIFNNSDVLMLGLIKNDYEVGIYSTAVKIILMVQQFVGSILWVYLPELSRLFAENDTKKINDLSGKIFSLLLTLCLPCVVGLASISRDAIMIIAGEEYIESTPSLIVLCLSLLLSTLGIGFCGNFILLPSKKEKLFMIVCSITAAANILANIFVIPLLGAVGAAITTAGGNLLALIILAPKIKPLVKISGMIKKLTSPLIGSIAIFLFCSLIKGVFNVNLIPRTIICIVGSAGLYISILWLTKNDSLISAINMIKSKRSQH